MSESFRERFPEEYEDVKSFINGHLTALSYDWGIRVPKWHFWPAITPGARGVYLMFSEWFIPGFKVDKPNAGLVLKHAIAHEFRHWLTMAAHIKIPIPKEFRSMRRAWSELEARRFAFHYSGISANRAWRLWYKVLDEIESKLGIPVPR